MKLKYFVLKINITKWQFWGFNYTNKGFSSTDYEYRFLCFTVIWEVKKKN